MHEVLLLGIAASELTVLLTSDPRRWSRRLSLFLTFLLAVICYSWFVLGGERRRERNRRDSRGRVVRVGPRRSVGARRSCSLGVGVRCLCRAAEPGSVGLPLLSLRSGRSIDLIIAVLFLVTGPVNHLITAILQCARGRASTPVPGWINAPVLPAMPVSDNEDADGDANEAAEPGVISGALPVLGAQSEEEVTALRGGRWIGPLERLLIIVLAGAGAEVAIAAVVAAKGVIRFPEISQDSTGEKAEEFLIGSVSSWILAALVSMLIRVVSLH